MAERWSLMANISGSGITLNINGTSGGIIQLAGNNTYSGGTTLGQAGIVLNINSATAIGSGTLTLTNSATIDNTSANAITLSNNNAIILSAPILTFTGTKDLSFGSGILTMAGGSRTITVTNSGATLTVGGVSQGASGLALTKSGAGTLVITGSSNYSGGTSISAGVLNIRNSNSLGLGSATISSGAALQLQGGITVGNSLTINGSGISSDGALEMSAEIIRSVQRRFSRQCEPD
jgi:fibronectin-binding autotransporter adhesin